ncbi:T9SS type A sorting domain-containing protein [Epilithonimonas sp. JDS]|uniref:ELWxxDGT repeat protein n=1 Tax=Epilithonimonas sp. JDS TaxID=2902797 RepID=UPI001E6054C6|nr:ELWxxDGT repeat protein [Epilithonimonas sp. JDS]MCD9855173.1 T9SS type A sorting domain-containing protein [Epilithonimonas sp. JDS]
MLKDINPGANPSTPAEFFTYNSKLYFNASSPTYGNELWSTDGTAEGTNLAFDINPGTSSSLPISLMNYNNKLHFLTMIGTTGLYSYDSVEGAQLVSPGLSTAANLLQTNDKIFYRLNNKLWYFSENTIHNIDTPVVITGQMGAVNGKIILAASPLAGVNNAQIYMYDGTAVSLIKTINPNTTSNPQNFYYSNQLNTLFFTAGSNTSGFELWKTDGTTEGTVEVKNINPGTANSFPGNLRQVGDKVFFSANNGANGTELWITDGTEEGTRLVKDINPGSAASNPSSLTELNGKLYFLASDGSGEARLWESDGTADGTKLTLELRPGYTNFVLGKMESYNGALYLSAKLNVANGQELYKIELPTLAVSDLSKKNSMVYPNPTSGEIFFSGKDYSSYDLYDLNGRLLNQNVKINDNKAYLSVPNGSYIMVGKTKEGAVNTTKIIVK